MLSSTQIVGKTETEREREREGKGSTLQLHLLPHHQNEKSESFCTICICEFLWGGGLVLCQIGSMAVRSEAQKKNKKKPLATNCVFLSAEGCSEGIKGGEGGGRKEGR